MPRYTQDELDQDALTRLLGSGTETNTTMPVPTATTTNYATNAPRVTQRPDGGYDLQEHGNTRALVGDEVGQAQAYASDFKAKFPTGYQPDNPTSLNDAYRQYTGRDADEAGLAAHRLNPGGFAGAIDAIANSDEARIYRNRPAGTTTTPGTTTTTNTTPTPPIQPSTFTGFTPKHAMEGFDFGREQNTGKSAKDAFAFLANQAPPPPLQDKAALAAWFTQYIKPGMNQLGHTITNVNGDTFGFENWQGKFTVDYGRGAGAAGGALAWQVDAPSAQLALGGRPPRTPAGTTTTPGTTTTGTTTRPQSQALTGGPPPTPVDPMTGRPPMDPSELVFMEPDAGEVPINDDALAQIQAEIAALIQNSASPMDQRAMMRLLGAE